MHPNKLQEDSRTTSQRYGNDRSIDEVFERETSPIAGELTDALAATAHLTEREAFAFVHGHLEGFPPVSDVAIADEIVQDHGFESISEFKSVQQAAKEKVADAIWMYELVDAYRFPDFPEECSECGRSLGGMWVESEEELDPLCRDCADVEAEEFPHPMGDERRHQ